MMPPDAARSRRRIAGTALGTSPFDATSNIVDVTPVDAEGKSDVAVTP